MINNQQEIKICSFEQLGDKSPHFEMYKLIKEQHIYPFNLLGEWRCFYEKKKIINEYYLRMVICDEETYHYCYDTLFNPIQIYCYNKTDVSIEEVRIGLCTNDDGYYGCKFNNMQITDFNDIFLQVNDYIFNRDKLNSNNFIYFLEQLGGKDVSY